MIQIILKKVHYINYIKYNSYNNKYKGSNKLKVTLTGPN